MGERVTFASNGSTASAYLARPSTSGPAPAVVVIQEWWGLVPHIERIADRFASEGFLALAPDLYHGKQAGNADEAGKMMMSLRIDEAARDLAGAVRFAASLEGVKSPKVGTVGFCMGGALSLYAACRNPDVGACVVFYGGHPNVKPALESLQAPVLGIYAAKDTFVTPQVVDDLDRQLTALGKRHTFYTYPQQEHAFFNDTRPEVYDAAAAEDAWKKTVAFLHTELKA